MGRQSDLRRPRSKSLRYYFSLFCVLAVYVRWKLTTSIRQRSDKLNVTMVSKSGCDGVECEDNLSGTRIWCTNLCAGLRLLGHSVTFASATPVTVSDVLVVSAALLKPSGVWDENAEAYARHLAGLANVFVICKPNAVPIRVLNMARAIPFGSMIQLQAEIVNGLEPGRAWLAKHTEVPLSYWKSTRGRSDSMYKYIAKHEPSKTGFTANKPARVCYHGSHNHVLTPGSEEIWVALEMISNILPLHIFIYSEGGRRPEFIDKRKVSIIRWRSVDVLFDHLKTCDLGIVPNLALPVLNRSLSTLAFPTTQFTFKHSANGGRAFVFAQVGVPMLGHPEFEYMDVLSGAGIDVMLTVATGKEQWYFQALRILNDPSLRLDLSQRLRRFAEENLSILIEVSKFEREIMQYF